MKFRIIYRIFWGLFFCINITLSAQKTSHNLSYLTNRFITFSKNFPQEKVYLHFDNTEYYLGETMWFKAYVAQANRNSLSELSKILYVELLNAEGNILDTKKLKIEDGQCNGEFDLQNYNYGGYYEVRAYTRYMLNFGSDNYFSRVFAVCDNPKTDRDYKSVITERPYSTRIPKIRKEYNQKEKLSVTFYPEGGNLVKRITSLVAFKATGSKGENATVSGEIYNENNELITEFSTAHNGMGAFSFMPDSGKYTAKITYLNKNYTFSLPEIKPKGFAMSINNYIKDKVNICIQKSENQSSDTLGINISCRGFLYAFEKVVWNNDNTVYLTYLKIYFLREFHKLPFLMLMEKF